MQDPLIGQTYDAIVAAPGFSLGIRCGDGCVREIVFLPQRTSVPARERLAAEAARQVAAYLVDPDFSFDLPLDRAGSDFQRRIWAAIAAIPRGRTRFYGEIARELRSAPRAVGQACGSNPFPLVVPCHRVIAANGLGGFANSRDGYRLHAKRWLLRHEGVL